ncbi:AMP-binding protein [Chlamydiifrater phoenicopteri]|uniref:AMP-binding protein n=1 Tax=Chlamydiifrater phoenicopteri TaxID=2681469 RepID=UPI001BCFAAA3|nr:AMP-binding protein [Chlamydiifrater phoenicopteri]
MGRQRDPCAPCNKNSGFRRGKTILEKFLRLCDDLSEEIVCFEDQLGFFSYKNTKRAIIALAKEFKKYSGESLGIMMPASIGAYISMFATLLAGKIPVMINWTQGRRELVAGLEKTQLKRVITSKTFLEHLKKNRDEENLRALFDPDQMGEVVLDAIHLKKVSIESIYASMGWISKLAVWGLSLLPISWLLRFFGVHRVSGDDTAVMLFTSGTENVPKCVPLTHNNLIVNQEDCFPFFDVKSVDKVISFLPPFHAYGFNSCTLLPLLAGVPLVFVANPLNINRIMQLMKSKRATIMGTTPTFYGYFLKKIESDPSFAESLSLVVLGGERVSEELYNSSEKLLPHVKVIQGYGATESSPVITLTPRELNRDGVGYPLPRSSIKILCRTTLTPLPEGNPGIVVVAGPSVFSGYYGEAPNFGFVNLDGEKYYNTGDIGLLTKEGYLLLLGRLSRSVKIGGEMVSLESVESILQEHFLSKKGKGCYGEGPCFVVCGLEREAEKTKLCLFTTLELSLQEVNEALKQAGTCSVVKISDVQKLEAIPLSGIGKPNYVLLSKWLENK